MEQVRKFRNALILGASRELDAFSRAIRQELTDNDEAHQIEIRRLKEQISFLRQKVFKADVVERELQHIQCHGQNEIPKATDASTSATKDERSYATQSVAGGNDYDELHRRFLRCSLELERVKEAMRVVQIQAKRWKDAYRSLYGGGPCRGSKESRDHANMTSRRRSAPELRQLVRAQSADVMTSWGKKSTSVAREKGTQVGSGLQDHRNDHDILGYATEPINRNGSRSDFTTSSSQTQDDGNAAISGFPMYTMPPMPQPRDIIESGRDALVGQQTKDAMDSDSESPIFVKENNLKRRRGKRLVEASRSPKRVKEELSSSSPAILHASSVTKGAQESIDLDEIPNPLYTPRKYQGKRRPMSSTPPRQSIMETHLPEDGDERHPFEKACTLLRNIGDGPLRFGGRKSPDTDPNDIQDEAWCHKAGEMYTAQLLGDLKAQRRFEARVKQGAHNLQERAKRTAMDPHNANTQHRYQSDHHEPTYQSVLQPVEANKAPSRSSDSLRNPPKRFKTGEWHHGAQYISYLSEDGENALDSENVVRRQHNQAVNPKTSIEIPHGSKLVNTSAEYRLDQLLGRPSPDKPRLNPESVKAGMSSATPKLPNPILKQNQPHKMLRTPPVGQRIQSTITKPKTAPLSIKKAPVTPHPSSAYSTPFSKSSTSRPAAKPDPPLRSRPVSHLFLDDFKVNPAQNQGYSHPFKEVVRSRDQRNCLPGCTRLECCGTIFRKMAETGLIKTFHTSRLFASSQEDEDQRMMEDFLGDQADRLRKMSEGEKAEVLLQAKTKVLADHYGRHREVYAREPSPIGYWDVDMPSTQQVEEQVKLAEARTRQKVEERYREAMRKDGLWKFRDE
ncbi:MAG: hypothetical protein Q9185_005535 [Variospora sp. 1 TL-2023]